jgi:tight adherence protein C
VGALLASGVLVAAGGLARRRALSPADRISPYVAGPSTVRRDDLGTRLDASTLERILGPSLRTMVVRLEGALGGGDALQARLAAAGRAQDTPVGFRLEQLTWTVIGLAGGGLALLLLAVSGRPVCPAAALALALVCGLSGALLRDRALSGEVRRRREAIRVGLPPVADLLALAVASGESPAAALDRVARVARGPPGSPPYAGSSTASPSPSSAVRRWPRSFGPRPATPAPTCTAACSRSPAARSSS